jgi:hypothetical protein
VWGAGGILTERYLGRMIAAAVFVLNTAILSAGFV